MRMCMLICTCVQYVCMRASLYRGVCQFSVIKDKELAGSGGLTPSQALWHPCLPAKESISTQGAANMLPWLQKPPLLG